MTTTFETRLLDELQQIVAAQPAPRARRRMLPAAATAVTVAAIALAVLIVADAGGPTPAYAVDKAADGTVTVEIRSLRDSAGLERKLADLGVRAKVDYLEPGMTCRAGRFKAAQGGGGKFTIGQGTKPDGTSTFVIDPPNLGAGKTLVVMARADSLEVAFADGAVGPCVPVKDTRPAPPQPPPTGAGRERGTEQQGG
jgi:hypothetical protein